MLLIENRINRYGVKGIKILNYTSYLKEYTNTWIYEISLQKRESQIRKLILNTKIDLNSTIKIIIMGDTIVIKWVKNSKKKCIFLREYSIKNPILHFKVQKVHIFLYDGMKNDFFELKKRNAHTYYNVLCIDTIWIELNWGKRYVYIFN